MQSILEREMFVCYTKEAMIVRKHSGYAHSDIVDINIKCKTSFDSVDSQIKMSGI